MTNCYCFIPDFLSKSIYHIVYTSTKYHSLDTSTYNQVNRPRYFHLRRLQFNAFNILMKFQKCLLQY